MSNNNSSNYHLAEAARAVQEDQRISPKYTYEDKLSAVGSYFLTQNSNKASKLCGIPPATIRSWKNTDWWAKSLELVKKQKQAELDGNLTRIIESATAKIEDRLDNGDMKLNAKTGELQAIPVTAKDLSTIISQLAAQRQLIRGEPTSRSAEKMTPQQIEDILIKAAKKSRAKEIEGEIVINDGEEDKS